MSLRDPKSEWNKIAQAWSEQAGHEGVWHQKNDIDPIVENVLGSINGKKIFEIGTGNGYFARKLAKKGARVIGTDISPIFISYAKTEENKNPLGISYLVKDATRLSGIKSNSFDIVLANMCFIDIPDTEKAIAECSRILKKGGRLVFSLTHPVFSDFGQSLDFLERKKIDLFCASHSVLFIFPSW